ESKGHTAGVLSAKDFQPGLHKNVYNRFTDFYFSEPSSQHLLEAYTNQISLFSPNPREYSLMADKNRLPILREEIAKSSPEMMSLIPETRLFSEFESKDALWSERKKYFFKPSQSFGSKGVFSGKGISRKAFEGIYSPNFLAQELCPAGRETFHYDEEPIEMKFDLRFYCFEGEIQHYTARLYQGQATNMKTDLGGLAPILFQ
ncbi:MAG: hypothetical protein AAF202_10705, partial [Pseudomonadota bacterium]